MSNQNTHGLGSPPPIALPRLGMINILLFFVVEPHPTVLNQETHEDPPPPSPRLTPYLAHWSPTNPLCPSPQVTPLLISSPLPTHPHWYPPSHYFTSYQQSTAHKLHKHFGVCVSMVWEGSLYLVSSHSLCLPQAILLKEVDKNCTISLPSVTLSTFNNFDTIHIQCLFSMSHRCPTNQPTNQT